jgi:hypothetical protein
LCAGTLGSILGLPVRYRFTIYSDDLNVWKLFRI